LKTKLSARRAAFTLVEVTFVIVVLGIVASLGAEMIANAYKSYVYQHATEKSLGKTEIAAQQIVNLLSQRVPGTTLARNPDNLSDTLLVKDYTVAGDNTHSLLEWIGAEEESVAAQATPGWSGFCDVDGSSASTVKTPGSDLDFAWNVMGNLYPGMSSPAIFFRDQMYSQSTQYNAKQCMGLVDNNTDCISSVSKQNATTLSFDSPYSTRPKKRIAEHYKLAATAYAICPKDNGDGTFDLILFYDYQPWEGERLSGTGCDYGNVKHATILTNVTVFKFAEAGNTFRFKLCAQENIGTDCNITSCKERAIIR
jgi:prepilin-type N-terminal cleavage/methylation domain-containing protein